METAKETFLKRYHEINRLHSGLTLRQQEIHDEIRRVGKNISELEKVEITAESLTDSMSQKHEMKSKQNRLYDELKSLREAEEKVKRQGGVQYLHRTDKKLVAAAGELYQELLAEAKKDDAVREKLEKRYEKVIKELLELEEERQAFNDKHTKVSRLISMFYNVLEGKVDLRPITLSYKFRQADAYFHLAKLKDFLRKVK